MAAKKVSDEWNRLWASIGELSNLFDSRLVFIGGIAVYLHVVNEKLPEDFIEFSHDGDFYISMADFGDLRDIEEVTATPRLNKYQIIKQGIDFDIYVEHHSKLRVGYEALDAASTVVEGVRIACLEHLLILKLEAFRARRGTAKGRKDERDLIKIVYLMQCHGVQQSRLRDYLTKDDVDLVKSVNSVPGEFLVLCENNAHRARGVRTRFEEGLKAIERTLQPRKNRRR